MRIIHFTHIEHPTDYTKDTGVTRITTGKYKIEGGRCLLPVASLFHHGLMDGIDSARCGALIEGFSFSKSNK